MKKGMKQIKQISWNRRIIPELYYKDKPKQEKKQTNLCEEK